MASGRENLKHGKENAVSRSIEDAIVMCRGLEEAVYVEETNIEKLVALNYDIITISLPISRFSTFQPSEKPTVRLVSFSASFLNLCGICSNLLLLGVAADYGSDDQF